MAEKWLQLKRTEQELLFLLQEGVATETFFKSRCRLLAAGWSSTETEAANCRYHSPEQDDAVQRGRRVTQLESLVVMRSCLKVATSSVDCMILSNPDVASALQQLLASRNIGAQDVVENEDNFVLVEETHSEETVPDTESFPGDELVEDQEQDQDQDQDPWQTAMVYLSDPGEGVDYFDLDDSVLVDFDKDYLMSIDT